MTEQETPADEGHVEPEPGPAAEPRTEDAAKATALEAGVVTAGSTDSEPGRLGTPAEAPDAGGAPTATSEPAELSPARGAPVPEPMARPVVEPVEPAAAAAEPVGEARHLATAGGEAEAMGGTTRAGLPAIDRTRLAAPVRTGLKVAVVVLVASVALGTAAFVAASFYGQYGAVRDAPNAAEWAALTPRFAGQAICTSCHGSQAAAQDASIHANVSCEDCHGPAAGHSASDSAARAVVLARPTSAVCITCHAATPGRPAPFPQVPLTAHYSGGACLRCHDPHSIVAVRPPEVTHPLADLPECTTCHAPDGLKKVPAGHELVPDAVCLACHGPTADRDRARVP